MQGCLIGAGESRSRFEYFAWPTPALFTGFDHAALRLLSLDVAQRGALPVANPRACAAYWVVAVPAALAAVAAYDDNDEGDDDDVLYVDDDLSVFLWVLFFFVCMSSHATVNTRG